MKKLPSHNGFCEPEVCTSCGACVYLTNKYLEHISAKDSTDLAYMALTPEGYKPVNTTSASAAKNGDLNICPGLGINYPVLYKAYYGTTPDNWLTGIIKEVRTGYASDPEVRLAGASGGITTRVIQFLLETGRIDGAVLARQGVPTPMEASAVVVKTPAEVLDCAGSVYLQVPMLTALAKFAEGKRYAMVCTPEQSAALRALQQNGDSRAKQVAYVLGPYTGTALTPQALEYYLKSNRIKKDDPVISVKWRAGKWPGYLEIQTRSGKTLRSPKVYYNFLIPFFVTRTSLLSMDFCNEFADLAVGDAWSPKFEKADEGGVSVVVTRTTEIESVIVEMESKGLLNLTKEDPLVASDMHGHMLDFKKRGGYLRGRMRRFWGQPTPSYGYRPRQIAVSRYMVELIISTIFFSCRTRLARWCVCLIPERWLGLFFNRLRLGWKAISRPTKRKGLALYEVVIGND